MEMLNFKSLLKRYFFPVLCLLLIILAIFQCNTGNELQTASRLSDSLATHHRQQAEKYIAQADALKSERPKYRDTIRKIRIANNLLQKEKQVLRSAVAAKIEKVGKFTGHEIQTYIMDRYGVTQVPITEKGIVVNDSLGIRIITDLVNGDGAIVENKIINKELLGEKAINKQMENDVCNLENQNSLLTMANKEKTLEVQTVNDQVKDLKESLKAQSRKTTGWKIVSAVLFAASAYQTIKR